MPKPNDYQVGILCALADELTAVMAMLDEEHDMFDNQEAQDTNNYVLGRIHKHNIVAACMPMGVDGLVSAATAATNMVRTFIDLRFCLMVGIGGGIPSKDQDVRLGDVVVGVPREEWGGVVQYDKGKALEGGEFLLKGQLNQPPNAILTSLNQLRAHHTMGRSKVIHYIEDALRRETALANQGFAFPKTPDQLYCAGCSRLVDTPPEQCKRYHVKREQRKPHLVVHYGTIASGNTVVKNAVFRDRLLREYKALCVEMEAAALMNNLPCLVIRGVCDYADAFKNDVWHQYAAMAAAAYAKDLLFYISPAQTKNQEPLKDVLGILGSIQESIQAQTTAAKAQTTYLKSLNEREADNKCLQAFNLTVYEDQKNRNPDRVEGTCKWLLTHPHYERWLNSTSHNLLWISADPGCGKSVFAKSLIEKELKDTDNHLICYFFFKDNAEQDTLRMALSSWLHQLLSKQRSLIKHALPAWEKEGSKLTENHSELWRILIAAARNASCNVTCVIDALDECRSHDQNLLIKMLSKFQNRSSVSMTALPRHLKFLITSRPYSDIERSFARAIKNLPCIHLRGQDDNDALREEVNLVVRLRVEELARGLELDDHVKDLLMQRLLEMEHRTYLWLYLAIDSIEQDYANSTNPGKAIVNLVPTDVDDAYEKILNRVKPELEIKVKTILHIILGARENMTVQQMAVALNLLVDSNQWTRDPTEEETKWLARQIPDWCGLFVYINHGRLYLIHQTAKEFLVRPDNTRSAHLGWKHSLYTGESQAVMARFCVRFLLSDAADAVGGADMRARLQGKRISDTRDKNSRGEGFSCCSSYAANHWMYHVRDGDVCTADTSCWVRSGLYNVSSWFYFWPYGVPLLTIKMGREENQPWILPVTRLLPFVEIATFLGHCQSVTSLLESDLSFDMDALLHNKFTLLTLAAYHGQEKVVQMLLARGAKANIAGERYQALNVACWYARLEIVKMLLDHKLKPIMDPVDGESALQAALLSRKCNEQTLIIRMLVKYGANVNHFSPSSGRPPLLEAIRTENYTALQLLLDLGADPDSCQGHRKNCALLYAVELSIIEAVKLLFEHRSDFSATRLTRSVMDTAISAWQSRISAIHEAEETEFDILRPSRLGMAISKFKGIYEATAIVAYLADILQQRCLLTEEDIEDMITKRVQVVTIIYQKFNWPDSEEALFLRLVDYGGTVLGQRAFTMWMTSSLDEELWSANLTSDPQPSIDWEKVYSRALTHTRPRTKFEESESEYIAGILTAIKSLKDIETRVLQ